MATMVQTTAHGRSGSSGVSSRPSSSHGRTHSSSSLKRGARERSHGDLPSVGFTQIKSEPSSSPEDEAPARIGPKRKSKVGIAGMSGTDALKKVKHDRKKGSSASLKDLGHGQPRKLAARQREAPEAEGDAAWVSASGEESASQTPERQRLSSRSGRESGRAEQPPVLGSTPIASPAKPQTAELSSTPTRPTLPPIASTSDIQIASPPKTAPLPTQPTSDVAFPVTASAPVSPTSTRKPRTARKPSNASIASRLSTRSLRQPLSAVVTLPPQLDATAGTAVISSSPITHSFAAFAEPRQSTSRTPSAGEASLRREGSSDLTNMLRETQTRNLPTSASRASLSRLSGQFGGALRGFLPHGSASSGNLLAHDAGSSQRQQPHPLSRTTMGIAPQRPFISKFISPSQLSPSLDTSAYTSSPLDGLTPSSSSSGTRLNRTQQRLLLQRAQPYRETEVSPNARATLLPPLNASTSPDDVAELNLPERQLQCQQAQRDWAKLLCREAERVDREHECVLKYRDPAGESFRRVLAARGDRGRPPNAKPAHPAVSDAKAKQKRPESLQRSYTAR